MKTPISAHRINDQYVVEVNNYFPASRDGTRPLKSRRYYPFEDADKAIRFMKRARNNDPSTVCRIYKDITGTYDQQRMDI